MAMGVFPRGTGEEQFSFGTSGSITEVLLPLMCQVRVHPSTLALPEHPDDFRGSCRPTELDHLRGSAQFPINNGSIIRIPPSHIFFSFLL